MFSTGSNRLLSIARFVAKPSASKSALTRGFSAAATPAAKPTRILITGSLGQIGTELVARLRKKYGKENVLATDIRRAPEDQDGPYRYLDVLDYNAFASTVVDNKIDWLIHNSSLLSATGERNPQQALDVNINGLHNALECAKNFNLRVLAPSSIAAFGPSTPRDATPDLTIMRPTTIYGITKLHLELLGEYYHSRWAVDFRSIRYPGVISSEALPGGGTTDYAVEIFYEALKHGRYSSFLNKDSALPMMYMSDCLKATQDLLEAPADRLTQRVYNVTAMSFTPETLGAAIRKYIKHFKLDYSPTDFRQGIANSWPKSLDDSAARRDWNWKPEIDLDLMTRDMLKRLSERLREADSNVVLQKVEL
eukprot:TRINITY_DN15470_c0_g1_i1.p1 TRINITY_DN15470_c0_g1~~TRINITY_DN15470_c0_g1_i1.p1  ORF type:complete len:365 (-),score=123.30 TRINITY_DN15470_c0_g1_i1:295-1389(-)